ncbi:MAG: IS5 family transposase [Lewinellaceae bacterium]|nr:IS5 family transposase [Lewinellaceae bacterium]
MIKYTPASERTLALFSTPFEQKLSPENRWVRMAELVPWDEMAEVFFSCLSTDQGRLTVDLRVILGALMVKHIERLSDEDTIQYIQENIYAQYFVGLSSFQIEPVFVPSLFVEIRKRLGQKGSARLNDLMIRQARQLKAIKHRRKPSDKNKPEDPGQGQQEQQSGTEEEAPVKKGELPGKQGTLLLDATVGPLHIAYPTDTRLLSEGRRHSEELMDLLYTSHKELWVKKPRTYRREAQRAFVSFNKKKNKSSKDIRKATGQQLRYLKPNLKILHKMLDKLEQHKHNVCWKHRQWRTFWVIQELYRQQEEMFRDRRRRIDDRIVSILQPYARPIKRGKGGGKDTEFGPKVNVSMSEGIAKADQIDFNAFNESSYLPEQIEGYKALYGYYPALVLADQIYWTRANRNYLKDRGIQMGGVPLGPPKELSKYEKYKARKRNNKRSEVECKFGQAKSKYGLDDLFTRLPQTIKAEINLIFLEINLIRVNKTLADFIFYVFFIGRSLLSGYSIPKDETRKDTAWTTGGRWMPKLELTQARCRTF